VLSEEFREWLARMVKYAILTLVCAHWSKGDCAVLGVCMVQIGFVSEA